MGEVTAFLSHSWSDEKEAPGAKHALVSRWVKRRLQKSGIEPTLWLVTTPYTHLTSSRICTGADALAGFALLSRLP